MRIRVLLLTIVLIVPFCTTASVPRWGRDGHLMVGLAAASGMPEEMPQFFRDAKDQLSWLNYDPDRWRNPAMVESNEAFQYDHFIDLEKVPDPALGANSRFTYLQMLKQAGIDRPETMGLLPFRILELTQRLTQEFRMWRQATDPAERGWIEQRIINDAGILGHYVADGSNPHHATIHFNGWDSNTMNPQGYTTDRTFHGRFESEFVGSNVRIEDVESRAVAPVRELGDVRADILAYLRRTNGMVRSLYELEKRERFAAGTASEDHKRFAVERLVAGTEMLRSVWYTAWRRSAM